MTWTLELPYARPPLTLNDRGNRHVQHRARVELMKTVHLLAKQARLPRGLEHVGIVLWWSVPDRRRRDQDNLAATRKACVDALTAGSRNHPGYGLTVDDDWLHVTSGDAIELVPGRPAALRLEITDLTEARSA